MKLFVSLVVWEGCPASWLDDEEALRRALGAAVKAGPFTPLGLMVHRFSPQGVTACALVGESHLALHTWPEEGRLFLDVASCSSQESTRRAVAAIAAAIPGGRLATLDERVIEAPAPTRGAAST